MNKKMPNSVQMPSKSDYKQELRQLQIELVKAQRHVIARGHRLLVIFEGRDAAGKDGVIKRIVEHLSPRETRVVALGKPSDREQQSWYFQRFVAHLPSNHEMVLFNRSWYNRAGVEHVLGFCTDDEYKAFLQSVVPFEQMLVESGMQLIKYYLDINHDEQKRRLLARKRDPLSQWKTSPVDAVALKHWHEYTTARDVMLAKTHHQQGQWILVDANDKKRARLNVIRDLILRIDCPNKCSNLTRPEPLFIGEYTARRLARLAR